jgi:pimeloyl-ACP methyl ester carboxylesterase
MKPRAPIPLLPFGTVRFFACALLLALAPLAIRCDAADMAPAQPRAPPEQSEDHEAFAEVYGLRIHYREAGSGPVVLLLHGLADNVHVWDEDVAPLAKRHRVVALDLPGFGDSDKPLVEYRPRTLADFVEGFLDARHIGRASLVGNSLGGFVAALIAIDRPERVDRLVLVDAAGYADLARALGPKALRALRLSTRDDLRYLTPLTFVDPRYASDKAIDASFAERMRAGDGYAVGRIVDSLVRGDDALDRQLAHIHAPTLVVWGEADRLIPLSYARRFAHDIAGAHLVVLPKCGHMPQVECAPAFTKALAAFLE